MSDPKTLTLGAAVKVGSILVHIEEAMSADGHDLDVYALKGLLYDADVQEWLGRFDEVLLPRKRATDRKEAGK